MWTTLLLAGLVVGKSNHGWSPHANQRALNRSSPATTPTPSKAPQLSTTTNGAVAAAAAAPSAPASTGSATPTGASAPQNTTEDVDSGAIFEVGASSKYSTIQAAVDAVKAANPAKATIFIHAGTYNEQVNIVLKDTKLTIRGETDNPGESGSNTVHIKSALTYKDAKGSNGEDRDATATVRVTGEVRWYNINIYNTAFQTTGTRAQDLAYHAESAITGATKGQGIYGCGLFGYQDTLEVDTPMLVAKSYISGAVDFIYGRRGQVVISESTIETLGTGWITASGRQDASDPSWFLITDSSVTGTKDITYLGRPWVPYARTTFQRTNLPEQISPDGWASWTNGGPNTATATFEEFQNTGPGAATGSRKYGKQRSSALSFEEVLGKDMKQQWWVDSSFLPNDSA
ncbi:hypothetical protein PYCC9005_004124 [Savitreella phatthalungensis]